MVSLEQFIEAEEWTGKEGLLPDGRYKSTWDAIGGCWNVGPGMTKGITRGTIMTKEEIDVAYAKELAPFEKEVDSLIKVPISSNQRTALVSFAYNVGEAGFSHSPLPNLINSGHAAEVPAHLKLYVHGRATGKEVVPGLVNRRNAETKLWGTPDKPAAVETPGLQYDPPVQPSLYVPHYDPSCPVPKGAVTLEMIMTELAALVNVPLHSTTAIIDQTGHKIVTATQSGLLVFATYILTHFNSAWDLLGINSNTIPVYAATAIVAAIEWYKHAWVQNSNDTTVAIINSLEDKLKQIEQH